MSKLGKFLQEKLLGRSDIYFDDDLYMRRWRLGPLWFPFAVRLHHIVRSDKDREFHDHPFNFVSLILKGGYREFSPHGVQDFSAGDLNIKLAPDLHRLELNEETWTLVFRGRIQKEWGFQYQGKWVPWYELFKLTRSNNRATGTVHSYPNAYTRASSNEE